MIDIMAILMFCVLLYIGLTLRALNNAINNVGTHLSSLRRIAEQRNRNNF